MKYNRSEIMRAAWNAYRTAQKWINPLSFGECLRRAWATAKEAAKDMAVLATADIILGIRGCRVNLRRAAIACSGRMGWYLFGQTYPVRKDLKAAGCEWDCEAKAWFTLDANVARSLMHA